MGIAVDYIFRYTNVLIVWPLLLTFYDLVTMYITENWSDKAHWCYTKTYCFRAPDKVCSFVSVMPLSLLNLMIERLLESSHRENSIKWSNIWFGEEITQAVSIQVNFTQLIWSFVLLSICLFLYSTKFYDWTVVRIVSFGRFYQMVKHRIWWRNNASSVN